MKCHDIGGCGSICTVYAFFYTTGMLLKAHKSPSPVHMLVIILPVIILPVIKEFALGSSSLKVRKVIFFNISFTASMLQLREHCHHS